MEVQAESEQKGHVPHHVLGDEVKEKLDGGVGRGEAKESSGGDEHEAFGDELANEA